MGSLQVAENQFRYALATGNLPAVQIAQFRRIWELMLDDRANGRYIPNFSYAHERKFKTQITYANLAKQQVDYKTGWKAKRDEWFALKPTISMFTNILPRPASDTIYDSQNSYTSMFLDGVTKAMQRWFLSHYYDKPFLALSATQMFERFVKENPEILMMFRLTHARVVQGNSGNPSSTTDAVSLAVALIPIVMGSIGLYGTWSEQTIKDVRMTDANRVLLASSALVSICGRLLQRWSAIYSPAQSQIFGVDTAPWTASIQPLAWLGTSTSDLKSVMQAEADLLKSKDFPASNASQLGTVVKALKKSIQDSPKDSTLVLAQLDKPTKDKWNIILQQAPSLNLLDEFATSRIIRAGPNESQVGCRILQELAEVKVQTWLTTSYGGSALGVGNDKKLEYFPGHLIRTDTGAQVTDGMLGFWNRGTDSNYSPDVFVIRAILEAKSIGKGDETGARELSFSQTDPNSLTDVQKEELRRIVKERWSAANELARNQGQPFQKTVKDIQLEVRTVEYVADLGALRREKSVCQRSFEDQRTESLRWGSTSNRAIGHQSQSLFACHERKSK
jgi:hypothetical protein